MKEYDQGAEQGFVKASGEIRKSRKEGIYKR
jgi:hypothetical protein